MADSGGRGGGSVKKRSGHRGGGGGGKRPRYGGDRPSTPAGPFVALQALRKGRALLVTCEVGRERQAVKELRVILDRFVEEHQGSDDEAEGPEEGQAAASVRDALQQEIAELRKAKGQGATIQAVDTGCKGTTGVSIPADFPLGPVAAAVRMLEEAQAGHSSSRSVVKLMPMERLCYGGDLNGLKHELRALLKERGILVGVDGGEEEGGAAATEAAAVEEPKSTYMISLNRRNFQAHSREEIYQAVGEVIGDRWKVDLKNPERVIVMEAIRATIGFGYCERWGEFKKYNLRQLQDQARAAAGGDGKKDEPADKDGEGDQAEEEEAAAEAGAGAEAEAED